MWEVRFFQMRVSGRRLSHIDPCKVWIKPFNDSRYPIWPPPRRGRGRRGAGADDGGDVDTDAAQVDLDLPIADAESEDDPVEVAMHREMDLLLSEGLAAMRANCHQAQREPGDQGAEESEQGPDCPPQDSDDESDNDFDSSAAAAAEDTMPAACADEAPAAAGLKGKADAIFVWPGGHGIIRYYNTTKQFTAECKCGHDKCVKTRQSTQAASMAASKNPSQNTQAKGRPLGYLGAWLLDGRNHGSKAAHWEPVNEILATTFEKRVAARDIFKSYPEAHDLLAAERPQGEHEPEEPAGLA